ncbi:MAG: hypothetical protein IH934_04845, partial [Nanoarchaeota archaeon]|nr:hypothetical protein [Nanoarchaeota archaeon]
MSFQNLNRFVDYIRAIQIKDDNDLFIGITGRKGCGKSTLSIQIARRYCERYLGEKAFNLKKYIAYNNSQIMEKFNTLPKFSPLIGDEAIRFVWSRDWNKSENKELARLSAQARTKKFIFFMNIPKLAWIDSAYREGMLDVWIWVHATFTERGKESIAMVFEPDDNQGQGDSWHMKYLRKYAQKKKHRIGRFTDIQRLMTMLKNHPCYIDSFPYPKLPQELYDRYLTIRETHVFEKEENYVSQKDSSKIALYNIKKHWENLIKVVNDSKYKLPTYEIARTHIFIDPITKEPLVTLQTLNNWYKEIENSIPSELK